MITTTLNRNLFHAKLVPLLRSREDIEIVVVSDQKGPHYDRVRWVWPSGWMAALGRLGGRLPLLAREIMHPRTRLVMAYSLVPHGLLAAWLGRLFRRPVWIHFIGGRAEIDFAHDKLVADNRVILASRNPHRVERIARRIARKADLIMVPGSNTKRYLLQQGYDPERIVTLHSAVDSERFYSSDAVRDYEVVVSAQLRARKRPIFTLQVLQKVLLQRPEARFCWMGNGPMKSQFDEAVDALGLRSCVTWSETDDVAASYRRSKVFLLCSVSEGLSLACMEAMACGAVPVASDCGDMSDVVRPGDTGELLSVEAPADAYADAVLRLLDDNDRRAGYSRSGIDLIRREHSFEGAATCWHALLSRIAVAEPPAPPSVKKRISP